MHLWILAALSIAILYIYTSSETYGMELYGKPDKIKKSKQPKTENEEDDPPAWAMERGRKLGLRKLKLATASPNLATNSTVVPTSPTFGYQGAQRPGRGKIMI